ncbi:MAG: twin-arginine translocation signal domain-containing protein, partial [Planctomycetaceae bacterium]|nr:twin-arginine translocation signal domain-containing protein [Planctomycetaceae bacterium]
MPIPIPSTIASRRDFLRTTSCGFGSLALNALLQQQATAELSGQGKKA